MTEPRKIQAVNEDAARLEKAVNDELAERWPKHSRLTKDWLIDNVVCKHLNGLWEYIVEDNFRTETPFKVHITRYLGPIDES
jgi:hypothetical protein